MHPTRKRGIFMKERCEYILYLLASDQKPFLARDLAEKLSVSPRTVKTEMDELKKELPLHGASLIAKRNFGYTLSIQDSSAFRQFYEQIFIKFSVTEEYGHYDYYRLITFYRHLVSLTAPKRIEELAEHFSVSISAMREYITQARDFLSSFHLSIQSRPWHGIQVCGSEAHIRLALTELYAIHFHLAVPDIRDSEYNHWVQCEFQERSDIRHNFLKTLRSSSISIRDTNSQRLVIYLIIARNRCSAGYTLSLTEHEKQAIQSCDVYEVAQHIYQNLSSAFTGFDTDENEIGFLAVQLLCNRDMGHLPLQNSFAPFLAPEAKNCAVNILNYLRSTSGLDFEAKEPAYSFLETLLIPILAKCYFHLDGLRVFMWNYENKVLESPLSVEFARIIVRYLEQYTGCSLSLSDVTALTSYVYMMLSQQDYNIRKLRIILVCDSGICFGKLLEQRLRRYYSNLISDFHIIELYEARRLDFKDYDAIIMDIKSTAYQYPLPWHYLQILPHENELKQIFDHILIRAYQFQEYLPDPDIIHIFQDYNYTDPDTFFQFIGFKHCKSDECRMQLMQQLSIGEKLSTYYTESKCAILFAPSELTTHEAIELYQLKNPGMWGTKKIYYLLYVCIDWKKNQMIAKIMENSLYLLSIDTKYFSLFMEDKTKIFETLVLEYLKIK